MLEYLSQVLRNLVLTLLISFSGIHTQACGKYLLKDFGSIKDFRSTGVFISNNYFASVIQ